jgi:hypothetical protein
MSCSSVKHRFETEKQKGLSFLRAMELYQEVEGSVAAHKMEIGELQHTNADPEQIRHLQEHITDGEKLLQEIKSLHLH